MMNHGCGIGWLVAAVGMLNVAQANDVDRFFDEIHPLLVTKCVSCHGPDKQEGGLRLDSLAAAKTGGDRGPAIVPGDANRSPFITAISFRDPDLQMPPKQKLSDAEIETLRQWVAAGSIWPENRPTNGGSDSSPIGDAATDARNPIRKLFGGQRLDLWSLRPPRDKLPESDPTTGSDDRRAVGPDRAITNPIDAFIRARLTPAGLTTSEPADRRTLIRRVTFDLIGLPPTPDEVEAFVSDTRPDAFSRLFARLIGSPRYGERQARWWLDAVRYADSHGYERDEFRPLAWQYRDYVIRSFNADKPFDQFIREQLAGDELVTSPPRDSAEADALIATGYLRLGQWDSTASIFQDEHRLRAEVMADLTNTTASAFLGLTFSCCQCHDHKYDPFSQADHYRLRAFFAGVTPRDDVAISLASEQGEIVEHNAAIATQVEPLQAELERRPEDDKPGRESLQKRIDELNARRREPRRAMVATDSGSSPPATHVLYQGDADSPRELVAPGFPALLDPNPAAVESPRADTSGRRLALANWIASPENPWTARVLVNRVWQQHFGVGLVATPNDFGYSGSTPTHPDLLDWLAVEFVRRGWSIKQLQRLIVTSAAYQQASGETSAGQAADPDNRLLWRQNVRRLDAESLRDSLLAVSGLLLPDNAGPPRWPPVPAELRQAQPGILEAEKGEDGGRRQGWYADSVEKTDVRSLFLVRKRSLPVPLLQAFDLPDTTVSCARRDTTVVAPQALTLLNSPAAVRYAQAFARRASAEAGDWQPNDPASAITVIDTVFQFAFQRTATDDERRLASEFLRRHHDLYAQQTESPPAERDAVSTSDAADSADHNAPLRALTDLCRAVLNLNEFVYLD